MAATKKGGLGRGLDALFADVPVRISSDDDGNKKDPAEDKDSVIYIKVHDITPNANQPRKVFNEEKLEELAASIRQNGINPEDTRSLQVNAGGELPSKPDWIRFLVL